MDGDDALLVQPYTLEDEREEVALGCWVCLPAPEDREVVEYLARLVEIGDRLGRECGQLGVDGLAAGHILGSGEVTEFVEVTGAAQALFE